MKTKSTFRRFRLVALPFLWLVFSFAHDAHASPVQMVAFGTVSGSESNEDFCVTANVSNVGHVSFCMEDSGSREKSAHNSSMSPGQVYAGTLSMNNYNSGNTTTSYGIRFTPPSGYEVLINDGAYVNEASFSGSQNSESHNLTFQLVKANPMREALGVWLQISGGGSGYWFLQVDAQLASARVGWGTHNGTFPWGERLPPAFASLVPHKEYIMNVDCFSSVSGSYTATFSVPDGYDLYVDGEKKSTLYGIISNGANLEHSVVLKRIHDATAKFGSMTSMDAGPATWAISLGNLLNGQSAGSLDFMHTNAYLDLIEELAFPNVQADVEVLKDQLVLRQIKTTQMLLDVVENSADSINLNFYPQSAVSSLSNGFYTFSGQPAISYLFVRQSGGDDYTLTRTEGSRSQQYSFSESGSTYTLDYPGSLKSLEKTASVSGNSETRQVSIERLGSQTDYELAERHDFLEIGKKLGEVTQTVGGSTFQKTLSYDDDFTVNGSSSSDWGSYGRINSVQSATGATTSFSYSSANDSVGRITQSTETYLDSQTITKTFDYAADWNGEKSLLSGYTRSAPLEQDFDRGHDHGEYSNSEPLNQVLSSYFGTGDEKHSMEYYRHHLWDTIYVELPHASTAKDGRKVSYMYQEGVYDETTHEFSPVGWDLTATTKVDREDRLSSDEIEDYSLGYIAAGEEVAYSIDGSEDSRRSDVEIEDDNGNNASSISWQGDQYKYSGRYRVNDSGYYKLYLENRDNWSGDFQIYAEVDTDPSDNVYEGDHWRETRFRGWENKTTDPEAYDYDDVSCTGYRNEARYFYDNQIENGFGAYDDDDSDDKYFRVDLGSSKYIAEIFVAGSGEVNGEYRSGSYTRYAKIQKSDDSNSWTTVHDFGSTRYEHGITVPINDTARYWRLYKEQGDGDLFVTEFRLTPSTNFEGPSELTTHQNKDISSIWLAPYKSFKEVIIRDKAGYVARTETHIFTGYSNSEYQFELVSWADIDNDPTGNPTRVEKSTGEIIEWEYTDGLMTAHIDAAGKRTEFQHDALGRVVKIIEKGAAAYGAYPSQADIVTDLTYNALDQVLTRTVTGGSEPSLSWSWEYDTMGRLTSETVPGPLTTTYGYIKENDDSITLTTTYPNGGTQTRKRFKDGTVKEVTGSAVVEQYMSYDGYEATTTYGSQNSGIESKVTFDSLYRDITAGSSGRVPHEKRYDASGRLISESPDLDLPSHVDAYDILPSTHYSYNTYGELSTVHYGQRSPHYSPPNSSSGLRTTDYEYIFEKIGSDWWKVSKTYTYPEHGGGRILAGETKTRLGGCSCGSTFETRSYDIHGNETIRTVTTDQPSTPPAPPKTSKPSPTTA